VYDGIEVADSTSHSDTNIRNDASDICQQNLYENFKSATPPPASFLDMSRGDGEKITPLIRKKTG